MDKKDKYQLIQEKSGKELEKFGSDLFKKIGLECFNDLNQVKLNDITSGYSDNEHLEFDYIIPEGKLCLIGEITDRSNEKDIRNKYKRFIQQVNVIKKLDFSRDLWEKLGVQSDKLRLFRDIEIIKGFFITTKKEQSDITLPRTDIISVFYKSDFTKLYEYSENIGIWTKNYFLDSFCPEYNPDNAITVYDKSLLRINNIKISDKHTPLADLYIFSISPYELLDIAHVYRRDELPSLKSSTYKYQRPLMHEKLKEIREKLLTDQDFIFPSNILVILSKECQYIINEESENFLHIPKKYGSLSVIDGQHRLFSYADNNVKGIMKNDCNILVIAVNFKTDDKKYRSQLSAKVFVDINANQTKVEISHLDKISYDLGSDEPNVIATKIIVSLNDRDKFKHFFDVNKTGQGILEAKTIINTIKKITNIRYIQDLNNPRSDKKKQKKYGYENLFNTEISELSERDILVKEGVVLIERYFNEVFSVLKQDKPRSKNDPKTSFLLAKFWSGWINLLIVFLEEGSDWTIIKDELYKIKNNIIRLREIDNYEAPLFKPDDENIPDSSHSPTKVCKFLNQNRKEPTSIQDIKK